MIVWFKFATVPLSDSSVSLRSGELASDLIELAASVIELTNPLKSICHRAYVVGVLVRGSANNLAELGFPTDDEGKAERIKSSSEHSSSHVIRNAYVQRHPFFQISSLYSRC